MRTERIETNEKDDDDNRIEREKRREEFLLYFFSQWLARQPKEKRGER